MVDHITFNSFSQLERYREQVRVYPNLLCRFENQPGIF